MVNESVIIDDKSSHESTPSNKPVLEILTNKQQDEELNKSSEVNSLNHNGILKMYYKF